MKKLLFTFFTFCSLIAFSQEKVQIIDSQTKKPIGFATITFGDGLGSYTNENGEFIFEKKQNFSVSMLGYKTLSVSETEFKNSIELDIEPFLIDEIVVSNKKEKQKISKQKPYWRNSTWLDSYTPQIGNEIAVLIPNEKNQDMTLSKITIPVATNPMRIFDKNKNPLKSRDDFPHTIIRIQFYKNENNSPKELLYSDRIIANVHNSKEKFKEIDLENYGIDIPENGLFVGIEFIGFSDENQKYLFVPNFRNVEQDGKKIKVAQHLNICIPIDEKSKKQNTFVRYSDWNKNGEKMKWLVFTEAAFLKLNEDRQKRKGAANVGLGYELKVYE